MGVAGCPMNPSTPKQIGIAVVEDSGCYLVGTRGPDSPLAGYAEFPGGKCLPGEPPQECAVRECLEEAQVPVIVERLLCRRAFSYAHADVDLHFFLCRPAVPRVPPQRGFRWVAADELSQLRFPEANAPVIEMLTRGQVLARADFDSGSHDR
jgi:8-oxo-dGTP diphosphatase